MVAPFSLSIVVLLVALALWGLVLFARGRAPERPYLFGLVIAEIELIIQAVLAVAQRLSGQGSGSLALFVGYIALSVVLLPAVTRPGSSAPRTRWDSITIAAICIAVGAVVVRLLAVE